MLARKPGRDSTTRRWRVVGPGGTDLGCSERVLIGAVWGSGIAVRRPTRRDGRSLRLGLRGAPQWASAPRSGPPHLRGLSSRGYTGECDRRPPRWRRGWGGGERGKRRGGDT